MPHNTKRDIEEAPTNVAPFASRSRKLAGTIQVDGPVARVFPLFSPLGERHWVPDWNPELLHPKGVEWAEGLIFRTRDENGEAIWVVTRLDPSAHEVEYHRVEPDRYVARVAVHCRPLAADVTEVSTAYEFVGLSEHGNAEIAHMNDQDYAEKMARWSRWINEYLHATA